MVLASDTASHCTGSSCSCKGKSSICSNAISRERERERDLNVIGTLQQCCWASNPTLLQPTGDTWDKPFCSTLGQNWPSCSCCTPFTPSYSSNCHADLNQMSYRNQGLSHHCSNQTWSPTADSVTTLHSPAMIMVSCATVFYSHHHSQGSVFGLSHFILNTSSQLTNNSSLTLASLYQLLLLLLLCL